MSDLHQIDIYEIAKQMKASLEDSLVFHGDILAAFPKGKMGLTPDDVKATPEWKKAKKIYSEAFESLRNFNEIFFKQFAPQIKKERHERAFKHHDGLDEMVKR